MNKFKTYIVILLYFILGIVLSTFILFFCYTFPVYILSYFGFPIFGEILGIGFVIAAIIFGIAMISTLLEE